MRNSIFSFLRKSYKLFSVFIFVIFFFTFYNTYLVDHSLINLRIALEKVSEAKTLEDLQKIKALLKVPLLKEISKTTISAETLFPLELGENIISTSERSEQIKDIKFYLKLILEKKKKERGAFLSALDRLNTRIYSAQITLPKNKLEAKAKGLLAKINVTKDKTLVQALYYDLGNLYMELADLSKAEEAYLKANQIDRLSPLALKAKFNLAWAYKSMGEYEKAVICFEEVAKESKERKTQVGSHFEIADSFYKDGEYQKAVEVYAQLTKDFAELDIIDLALYEAGYISYYNLDKQEEAIKYFSQLEEEFPKSKLVRYLGTEIRPAMAIDYRERGFRLLKLKRYIEAIENFRKAIEIAPLDARSWSGMGLGFFWLEDKNEALDKIKKATEITLEDEVVQANTLFVYFKCGKFDEAINLGEEVLSKGYKTNYEFHYNLGCAYLAKRSMLKARAQFKKTIELEPLFSYAYNNLGCVFLLIREYEKAINQLKTAVSLDENYTDAHYNLGHVYFYVQELEKAYEEFKKTLEIDPNYKEAEIYLQRVIKALKYKPEDLLPKKEEP